MERPTLVEMYKDFLSLVKKSRVGTIIPEEYVRVLNLAVEEAVATRLGVVEMTKKIHDDLSPLKKIVKDQGVSIHNNDSFPAVLCTLDNYRRVASLNINLSNDIKNVKCHLLSSIEKTDVLSGYYSKPSRHKCYYTPYVDTVGEESTQKIIIYIPSDYTNNENINNVKVNVVMYEEPVVYKTTDVFLNNIVVSVKKFQFGYEMASAVVNIAARIYIEGNADPRYQSFMNEQQIKQIN